MNYTNEMIVGKLEAYNSVKEKLALLCYELSHPAQITDEDYLEAVAIGSPRMDPSTKGCGSNLDKTLGLALSYREKADRLNAEVVSEVFREWQELQTEINRMDFYMGLLSAEHRQVLQMYYVQSKKWTEIESETSVPKRTLMRRRTEAIDRLTEMYNYTGKLTNR